MIERKLARVQERPKQILENFAAIRRAGKQRLPFRQFHHRRQPRERAEVKLFNDRSIRQLLGEELRKRALAEFPADHRAIDEVQGLREAAAASPGLPVTTSTRSSGGSFRT